MENIYLAARIDAVLGDATSVLNVGLFSATDDKWTAPIERHRSIVPSKRDAMYLPSEYIAVEQRSIATD